MKRRIALVLAGFIMLSCLCIPISAANLESYELLRWVNIQSIEGRIAFNKTSGNYSMVIEGAKEVDKITATAKLYYKNSSGKWIEIVKDWTYDVDKNYLAINEDFTGVSGREYKVELEVTVYMNGYGEEVSKTTTKTCP